MRTAICALALFLAVGCGGVLPALVQIGAASQLVSTSLGQLARVGESWTQRYPERTDDARRLWAAIERAQRTLSALQLLGVSASAYEIGDATRARSELLAAYSELYALATELGLVRSRGTIQSDESALRGGALLEDEIHYRTMSTGSPFSVSVVSPKELSEVLR